MSKKLFTPKQIEQFVKEHIQQKIDNHELHLTGMDMKDEEHFKHEFLLYETNRKNTLSIQKQIQAIT